MIEPRAHSPAVAGPRDCRINVTYVNKDGSETHVKGKPGQNLLRLAQKHDVELEGACECSIACSTCHVVVDDEYYDLLPEASEEEEDMLDLAFGLEPTSRLGCQVVLTDELDGIRVSFGVAAHESCSVWCAPFRTRHTSHALCACPVAPCPLLNCDITLRVFVRAGHPPSSDSQLLR